MATTIKHIRFKFLIISIGLFAFAAAVVVQLFNIQFVYGDFYRSKVEELVVQNVVIHANRGNIVAEDGSLLATSVPKYDIHMDPVAPTKKTFDKNIDALSDSLGRFYNKPASYYKHMLTSARSKNDQYVRLARNLGYADYVRFTKFPMLNRGNYSGGLLVSQSTVREYPLGEVAKRTIGYERTDEQGNVTRPGIDGAFGQAYLKGIDGKRLKQKIGQGQWKPLEDFNRVEPRDGYDLYTTIDVNLQDVAHYALLDQLEKFEADHGSVIVMETKTGAIKAISNLGRTTANTYYEKLNYGVGETHEPGSTFKLMALAVGIDQGVISPNDTVDTKNGELSFYGRQVRDSKKGGYGKITVAEAFEMSSNTGIVQIIEDNYRNNPTQFVDGIYAMGLNEKLDIPILGEGTPHITHPSDKENWDGLDLPWMAFGYGIQLSPLQVLTFYNAIANDGVKIKPRFVESIQSFGKPVEVFSNDIQGQRICKPETAQVLKSMMRNVVASNHGTAHNIDMKNYPLAGKTGTCQTEYWIESNRYISSFVGYFPADNPKYSCIVVIHKPNVQKGYYGNVVAAPVFKKIAEHIYTSTPREVIVKNVKPAFSEIENDYSKFKGQSQPDQLQMPNVTGMAIMDAISILENLGLKVEAVGVGKVSSQSVEQGQSISKGQIIKLQIT